MSAAAAVLPYVWAFAGEPEPILPEPRYQRPAHLQRRDIVAYRRYTQALLHRYLRMCMEAGKVPSLMGQEVLRGHASSYRVDGFDDVVMADLCVLKSQMKEVVGNGHPGRISLLEDRVFDHEKSVQRLKGMAAAWAGCLRLHISPSTC